MDTEEVEATYVSTAARMTLDDRARPRVLHARPVTHGDTGPVVASTVGAGVPENSLVLLRAYQWDSLYNRMRQSPVEGR